jgi:hypothetical protein
LVSGFLAIFGFVFGVNLAWRGRSSRGGTRVAKLRDDRQRDLLWPGLEDIIDLGHPLGAADAGDRLTISRSPFLQRVRAGDGCPPLPTKLVAGLLIPCTTTPSTVIHRDRSSTSWKR